MTLEAGNCNAQIAAPYDQPKPVPKKKVTLEPEPAKAGEPAPANLQAAKDKENKEVKKGSLEGIMNICKDNKIMSLLVVVAAGALVYYIVDSYAGKK